MNWFNILSVYVLSMRGDKDICKIKQVYLLKNDFWRCYQQQIEENQGFLCKVQMNFESSNDWNITSSCFLENYNMMKFTNFGYIVLKGLMTKYVTSFLNLPEENSFLLRFLFLYTDNPVYNFDSLIKYKGKIQERATYNFPKKVSENIISLKSIVSTDSLKKYILRMFEGLICMKIFKFKKFIKKINATRMRKAVNDKIEDEADFNLYYFKNHSECLKNLKKFIKDLSYFKLMEDFEVLNSSNGKSFGKAIIMNVSELKECVYKKCYEKLKELYDNENWKSFLDECFNYLENKILKEQIFFLIGRKYNIEYYTDEFYNLFYESVKGRQDQSNASNLKDNKQLNRIFGSFKKGIRNLQLTSIQNLFESEYIPNHFSKLLLINKETSDDYTEIEKMMCDYLNMFVYITNLYRKFFKKSSPLYSYTSPLSTDNHNLMIIDGIQIKLNQPNKLKKIRGFNEKGELINMMKNIDFFIDEVGLIYCSSDALEMKNIQVIEVVSINYEDYEEKYMRFKINEYLVNI